jgi:hypothetical protein
MFKNPNYKAISHSVTSYAREPSQLDMGDTLFSSNLTAQKPKYLGSENGKLNQMSDSNTKLTTLLSGHICFCPGQAYLPHGICLRASITELLRDARVTKRACAVRKILQRVGNGAAILEAVSKLGQALEENETISLSGDHKVSFPFRSSHLLPI